VQKGGKGRSLNVNLKKEDNIGDSEKKEIQTEGRETVEKLLLTVENKVKPRVRLKKER